ncbi:hypothetical protein NHP21011_10910 [Helicobacter heilmannii]|nr:hypothetical protein NHP21011_10910 [Helicobacter heilmannii]
MALTAQHPQPAKKTRPAQTDKGKTQVQTVTLDQKEVKANQRKAEISKAIKTNKLLEENKEKANSKPAGIKEKKGKPQVLATKKTRPAQTEDKPPLQIPIKAKLQTASQVAVAILTQLLQTNLAKTPRLKPTQSLKPTPLRLSQPRLNRQPRLKHKAPQMARV